MWFMSCLDKPSVASSVHPDNGKLSPMMQAMQSGLPVPNGGELKYSGVIVVSFHFDSEAVNTYVGAK